MFWIVIIIAKCFIFLFKQLRLYQYHLNSLVRFPITSGSWKTLSNRSCLSISPNIDSNICISSMNGLYNDWLSRCFIVASFICKNSHSMDSKLSIRYDKIYQSIVVVTPSTWPSKLLACICLIQVAVPVLK